MSLQTQPQCCCGATILLEVFDSWSDNLQNTFRFFALNPSTGETTFYSPFANFDATHVQRGGLALGNDPSQVYRVSAGAFVSNIQKLNFSTFDPSSESEIADLIVGFNDSPRPNPPGGSNTWVPFGPGLAYDSDRDVFYTVGQALISNNQDYLYLVTIDANALTASHAPNEVDSFTHNNSPAPDGRSYSLSAVTSLIYLSGTLYAVIETVGRNLSNPPTDGHPFAGIWTIDITTGVGTKIRDMTELDIPSYTTDPAGTQLYPFVAYDSDQAVWWCIFNFASRFSGLPGPDGIGGPISIWKTDDITQPFEKVVDDLTGDILTTQSTATSGAIGLLPSAMLLLPPG